MSHDTCNMSRVTCQVFGVTFQMSHVTCQVFGVTFQVSHVTCNSQTLRARKLKLFKKVDLLPPVTGHVSHVTCHMSYVTLFFLYFFLFLVKAENLVG